MIRRAMLEDVEFLKVVVEEYYKERNFEKLSGVPVREASIEITVRDHILNARKAIFLSVSKSGKLRGVIAGVLAPWPVNYQTMCVQDTIAWGQDIHKLREALDEWAASKGASVGILSCFEEAKGVRMHKIKSVAKVKTDKPALKAVAGGAS